MIYAKNHSSHPAPGYIKKLTSSDDDRYRAGRGVWAVGQETGK